MSCLPFSQWQTLFGGVEPKCKLNAPTRPRKHMRCAWSSSSGVFVAVEDKQQAVGGTSRDGDQHSKFRQRRLVQTFADPKSMKNSSLRYFFNRVRLTHFDVGVRKPMFKWQACFHRILTAHINRISSAIDLEDVALMRETAIHRNASFHGDTPSISSEALCARRDTVRSATLKSLTWILL